MKCINHPEQEQVADCKLCGGLYCEECLVSLNGTNYCKKCLTEKLSGQSSSVSGNSVPVIGPKSRFWAFVFSLIPGVGYLYLELMNRGLQTMLLFFGSIFISSFINFEQIMALVVPVVMFYSIFDTQQLVKKMNSEEQVGDRPLFDLKAITFNQSWIGYGLIVIGLLALLNGVLPRYLPILGFIRSIMPSILIIGTGLLILYRNTRKES